MSARSSQEVVLVRHGETEWALNGRHTSTTDLPLTANGEREAQAAARALAGRRFDLVLSSPLQRARETCRLAGYDAQAQLRPDLTEWDYGDYEGLTTAQIREREPGWTLWADGCPGGEVAADVAARVDRVIAEVQGAGGDAILFAHGHVLRVLGARWMEMAPEAGGRLALSTASICVLGFEHETAVTWRWNDVGHLDLPA